MVKNFESFDEKLTNLNILNKASECGYIWLLLIGFPYKIFLELFSVIMHKKCSLFDNIGEHNQNQILKNLRQQYSCFANLSPHLYDADWFNSSWGHHNPQEAAFLGTCLITHHPQGKPSRASLFDCSHSNK